MKKGGETGLLKIEAYGETPQHQQRGHAGMRGPAEKEEE